MRNVRFPIAGLMGAILVIALGLAALHNATYTWAGVTFLATCGVLCLAIVGIVCRNDADRAWWLGFALFGWGYLALAFWSPLELPTMALLDAIGARLGVKFQFSGRMGGMGGGMRGVALKTSLRLCLKQLDLTYSVRDGLLLITSIESAEGPVYQDPFLIAGHCLLALFAAGLGGAVAPLFCLKPSAHAAP